MHRLPQVFPSTAKILFHHVKCGDFLAEFFFLRSHLIQTLAGLGLLMIDGVTACGGGGSDPSGYSQTTPGAGSTTATAAANGTIIELNASAWRLDMDWRWWRLAKEKGVKCSINPDAHSPRGLQDVLFGIRAARKGWLTRQDVINCLPLGEVEQALRAKVDKQMR